MVTLSLTQDEAEFLAGVIMGIQESSSVTEDHEDREYISAMLTLHAIATKLGEGVR